MISERLGDKAPWAEPSWYNTLDSPYYNDSHRALRRFVRQYIDTNVLPFSEEWEKQGHVPVEVRQAAGESLNELNTNRTR